MQKQLRYLRGCEWVKILSTLSTTLVYGGTRSNYSNDTRHTSDVLWISHGALHLVEHRLRPSTHTAPSLWSTPAGDETFQQWPDSSALATSPLHTDLSAHRPPACMQGIFTSNIFVGLNDGAAYCIPPSSVPCCPDVYNTDLRDEMSQILLATEAGNGHDLLSWAV